MNWLFKIAAVLVFLQSVATLASAQISPITASDNSNSANAAVLVDGSFALASSAAWAHDGNQWDDNQYPWNAVLDLGQSYTLSSLKFFSGPIPYPSTAKLTIKGSNTIGQGYTTIGTATAPSYDNWNTVVLTGQFRYLKVGFIVRNEHFEITEIEVFGTAGTGASTPPPTPSPVVGDVIWNPNTNLQAATPPPAQQAYKYTHWPSSHLSDACRKLHDRYWTRGPKADPAVNPVDPNDPEYQAYHTWHPAKVGRCDFGHEHGHNPTYAGADMFNLFGGWPAFGYAAAKNGDRRHEDHVGHKVTVATYGAALGDGANTNSQIWPAGFECKWLSKIHQGSWSTDAFKNHLHEYFLALSCDDGPGGTPGTRLSIKFLYTFGRPNEFNSLGCTPNPQYPWNVQGPDGTTIGATTQTSPLPNESANGREFPCYDALGWHPPEDLQQVDLWTQPISIERGGDKPIFLQPYYIVKNPARVLKDSTSVKYTVDLCQNPATFKSGFCDAVTSFSGNWNSPGTPFNGALRSLNFKKISLYNDNKPEIWCTNAFGRGGSATLPCGPNQIEQYANSFRNGWDWKTVNRKSGEVKAAWWTKDQCGNVKTAQPMNGGYKAFGLGFEYVVDMRNPDDDCNNVPDGANLRGQN